MPLWRTGRIYPDILNLMDRSRNRTAVQGKQPRVAQKSTIKSTFHSARHTINHASYSRMTTRFCLSDIPRTNGIHISHGTRRFMVKSTTGIEIHSWRSSYSFRVLRTRMRRASMHLLALSRQVTSPRKMRRMHYVLLKIVSRLI